MTAEAFEPPPHLAEPGPVARLLIRFEEASRAFVDSVWARAAGTEVPVRPQREAAGPRTDPRTGLLVVPRSKSQRKAQRRTVALVLATTMVAVPALGMTEEVFAMASETFLGVPSLPDVDSLNERSRVLDVNGELLGYLSGPENRSHFPLDQVPEVVLQAIIATEDAGYWTHDGVEVTAILRAAWANLTNGEIAQGGSTITQQYVKNVLLTPEQSMRRKITEATWSIRLEQRATKNEILEGYLNAVYFGNGTYGIKAASEYWFGRQVQDLDLPRAAILAALLKGPEALDPIDHPDRLDIHRRTVLTRMVTGGLITQGEADAATPPIADLLNVTPLPEATRPLFVQYVSEILLADERLGATREDRAKVIFGGGLTINTTLDSRLQQAAQTAIAARLVDPLQDPLGGIVSVTPGSGAIRAMALGPKEWGTCAGAEGCITTMVNPLVPGMGSVGRQVGSAFKPIVAATALEAGVTTAWHTSTPSGVQVEPCGDYAPANYSDRDGGLMDMPEALRQSNNVFHVKLAVAATLENVATVGARLGFADLPAYCSVALGSVEAHPITLASAYASFAADGVWCEPFAISTIVDRDGSVLASTSPECHRAITSQTAAAVATMLQDVVASGTAKGAAIGRPLAAKTGTTNDNRDAWLVGTTPQLATAVWVGHEIPREMPGVTGGSLPATIFADYMRQAHEPWDIVALPNVDLDRWRCTGGADADSYAAGEQPCAESKPQKDKGGGKEKGGGKGKKK